MSGLPITKINLLYSLIFSHFYFIFTKRQWVQNNHAKLFFQLFRQNKFNLNPRYIFSSLPQKYISDIWYLISTGKCHLGVGGVPPKWCGHNLVVPPGDHAQVLGNFGSSRYIKIFRNLLEIWHWHWQPEMFLEWCFMMNYGILGHKLTIFVRIMTPNRVEDASKNDFHYLEKHPPPFLGSFFWQNWLFFALKFYDSS